MKLTFTFFLSILCIMGYSQSVKRITADMNLQTEITNASPGTTFLVEPGSYGALSINKRVALIGSGYFQSSGGITGCTSITFMPGSDNSLVSGFSIASSIGIGSNGVIIQRNRIGGIVYVGYAINSSYNVGGTIIKQNFIEQSIYLWRGSNNLATNTLIKNNIILSFIRYDSDANSGESINNTILSLNGCYQEYSSNWAMAFSNNIISSNCNYTHINGRWLTNSTFTNNLINTTEFNTNDASNVKINNFNNVFIGYPNNTAGATLDGRYQLLAGSPAKGIGIGAVDAGAFGGTEPYVLQGIPIGPNIIKVTAPTGAAAGQTISVQIEAKTQN